MADDLDGEYAQLTVAPFAGAWIEICAAADGGQPLRVAPFAGAWIEIDGAMAMEIVASRRSLRGSVD